MNNYLNLKEVSDLMGVSVRAVSNWAQYNKMPSYKLGGMYRVPIDAFRKWLKEKKYFDHLEELDSRMDSNKNLEDALSEDDGWEIDLNEADTFPEPITEANPSPIDSHQLTTIRELLKEAQRLAERLSILKQEMEESEMEEKHNLAKAMGIWGQINLEQTSLADLQKMYLISRSKWKGNL